MARCQLDVEHPNFLRSIGGNNADPSLKEGLSDLKDKVAKDHTQADWFNQPMPKFPQYQNRIWKWSFAPVGIHSSTRKKWRMLAYVPEPKAAEPIPATAFFVYSKGDTEVLTAKEIAGILKAFLTTIEVKTKPDPFRRYIDSEGTIHSLCQDCCEMVARSKDEAEVEILEGTHECPSGTE